MSIGDGTIILLVICLVFAVGVACYCLAKLDAYGDFNNKLLEKMSDEYLRGYYDCKKGVPEHEID
ncbi:hypothetical protein NHG24_07925 [Aerococcaceae bacterium NML210727]|nr:hypothetical protein [Aerococcaceae bacterium NML210727]MCW6655059.1 hypothetical protein [Aerococcaceae bacterium NML201296]